MPFQGSGRPEVVVCADGYSDPATVTASRSGSTPMKDHRQQPVLRRPLLAEFVGTALPP
jgi:hypothetical protein